MIDSLLKVLNHLHRLFFQIQPAHMYLPDRSPLLDDVYDHLELVDQFVYKITSCLD
jgi:hypothetical protein